jgi:hypothetical protein
VVEQVDSAPYAYFRLESPAGERWVALPIGTVPRGGVLAVSQAALVRNHRIPGTGRTFDAVYFGRLEAN